MAKSITTLISVCLLTILLVSMIWKDEFLYGNSLKLGILFLSICLLLIGLFYKRIRLKKRAFALIQRQKTEINFQKKRLEAAYHDIQQLNEIGKKITASLAAEVIINTTYEHVNLLIDAAVFSIGVYRESKEVIEFKGAMENGEILEDFEYDATDFQNYLSALCLKNEEEIIIHQFSEEYARYLTYYPISATALPESVIYIPLQTKNKVLGVLTVQSYQVHAYNEYQIDIIRNLANYSAIALENATIHHLVSKQRDEIEKLYRELNHRVRNNLQIISSLLRMQARRTQDTISKSVLLDNQSRLQAISLVHQKLYLNQEINMINTKEYIQSLLIQINQDYRYIEHIKVKLDIQVVMLEADIAIPLGLIINELVGFTIKYSFEGANSPELNISLKQEESLCLTIRHNGKSKAYEVLNDTIQEQSLPFEMKLVYVLATEQLKGKFEHKQLNGWFGYQLIFDHDG